MGGAVAFCDTFNAPSATGNRSGDLNGNIWGVSRGGDQNPPQGIYNAVAPIASPCGGPSAVWPVRICNGQFVDTVDDHEGVSVLAMYPKQPFDFAGRTGTISFDVSNDTQGIHAAWPELWITAKPTPAPMDFFGDPASTPENGIGLIFNSQCGDVGAIDLVSNYNITEPAYAGLGCIALSNGSTMNHYEVRISPTSIDVYGSDAGSTTLKHLDTLSGVAMPITRGLVWINDVHYNACKFDSQCRHSFRWDNVAFDGPYTYNDLTYDVLDNTATVGDGRINLGWYSQNDGRVPTLTTVPIPDQATIDRATGTFVLLSGYTSFAKPATYTISLNGHAAHTFTNTNPSDERATLYFPVPASDIVPGANTLKIYSNTGGVISNVDILLVAAGAAAPLPPPPPPTLTPTPTKTSGPSPSPSPSPTATPTQQSSATATKQPAGTPTKQPATTPTSQPPAPPAGDGAWTLTSSPSMSSVQRGSDVMVMTNITSTRAATVLVDVELYDASGKRVLQQFVDEQVFDANNAQPFGIVYKVPSNRPAAIGQSKSASSRLVGAGS